MKTKKGMVLLQVLVMTAVFMLICVMMVKQSLQSKMLKKKAATGEEASGEMEALTAKVWACLNDAGYPPAGDCGPTGQQQACVPSGTDVDFTGSYPACRIRVSVDK